MENNTNTTGYQRKVGLFGSIRKLGVTTIAGANDVVIDTIGVATDLTGSCRIGSSVVKASASIWGENLLEDLEADREIDRMHRQIERLQQKAELDRLKAQLAQGTNNA